MRLPNLYISLKSTCAFHYAKDSGNLVGSQLEGSVLFPSDHNIWDQFWRWSTLTGQTSPTKMCSFMLTHIFIAQVSLYHCKNGWHRYILVLHDQYFAIFVVSCWQYNHLQLYSFINQFFRNGIILFTLSHNP